MNGCVNGVLNLSCLCCHGDGPRIELIPPCPCVVKKYVCDPELTPSPDILRLYKSPGGVSHVKSPIRRRLNYGTE